MLNRRLIAIAGLSPAPPEKGIVRDGLIFHLDGYQRGAVSTQWTELISGKPFTFKNGVTEIENGAYFPGSESCVAFNDEITRKFGDAGTFQIVCEIKNYYNSRRMFTPRGANDGQFSVGLYDSGASIIWSNVSKPKYPLTKNASNRYTLSIDGYKMFENFVRKSPMSAKDRYTGETTGVSVGGSTRYSTRNNQFIGNIYAIRIYDRVLTDDEVFQNQQYDIDTYFGGVSPV